MREAHCCDRADVVFTGGQSLYEAKRRLHAIMLPLPSSIDVAHFHQARGAGSGPGRPGSHPAPRGRLLRRDRRAARLELVARTAEAHARRAVRHARPGGQDRPGDLPQGEQSTGWAASPMPSCRPISALGCRLDALRAERGDALHQPDQDAGIPGGRLPLVSTAIVDVVRTYGAQALSRSSMQRTSSPSFGRCWPRPRGCPSRIEGGRVSGRHVVGERPGTPWPTHIERRAFGQANTIATVATESH